MKNPYKQAFTLVELIIVVSILIILTSISIISYDTTLTNARNSGRITDMSNLKVSLKNHKLKQGSYPKPGNILEVSNNGLLIVNQGKMSEEVVTQEIINTPKDPLTKGDYMYSIMSNRQKFQIAMSMEDASLETESGMRAFVDGDYQKSTDMVPSIVFASSVGGELSSLESTIIVDKGTYNIPYDSEGEVVSTAADMNEVMSEDEIQMPSYYGYYSCVEIYENGAYMGTGSYKMLDVNGNVITQTCDGANILLSL